MLKRWILMINLEEKIDAPEKSLNESNILRVCCKRKKNLSICTIRHFFLNIWDKNVLNMAGTNENQKKVNVQSSFEFRLRSWVKKASESSLKSSKYLMFLYQTYLQIPIILTRLKLFLKNSGRSLNSLQLCFLFNHTSIDNCTVPHIQLLSSFFIEVLIFCYALKLKTFYLSSTTEKTNYY